MHKQRFFSYKHTQKVPTIVYTSSFHNTKYQRRAIEEYERNKNRWEKNKKKKDEKFEPSFRRDGIYRPPSNWRSRTRSRSSSEMKHTRKARRAKRKRCDIDDHENEQPATKRPRKSKSKSKSKSKQKEQKYTPPTPNPVSAESELNLSGDKDKDKVDDEETESEDDGHTASGKSTDTAGNDKDEETEDEKEDNDKTKDVALTLSLSGSQLQLNEGNKSKDGMGDKEEKEEIDGNIEYAVKCNRCDKIISCGKIKMVEINAKCGANVMNECMITYTMDGSKPTMTSNVYKDTITVNVTTAVFFKAFKSGMIESAAVGEIVAI